MGIIRAMAVMGPSPGNMPMNVPAKHPTSRKVNAWSVNAALRPMMIPSNMSAPGVQQAGPGFDVNAKAVSHQHPEAAGNTNGDADERDDPAFPK